MSDNEERDEKRDGAADAHRNADHGDADHGDAYLERIAKNRVSVIQPNAAIILVAGIAMGLFIGIRNDTLIGTVAFWVFALVLTVVLNMVIVRRKRRELLTDLRGS